MYKRQQLRGHGYDENLPADDPKKLIVKRSGLAGFLQIFVMDPDFNVIELNNAPIAQ